jgi:hypothetical protein
MIDEEDTLYISVRWSSGGRKSMRRVYDLSLIFIDIYVPAHTPRLNSTETSLQLSENITPGEHETLLPIIFYFKFI